MKNLKNKEHRKKMKQTNEKGIKEIKMKDKL